MKSFKFVIFSVFLFISGNYIGTAQYVDTSNSEILPSKSVRASMPSKKKNKTKARPALGTINTAETAKLQSKSEIKARAITAQNTKNSSKRNITALEAKRQRAARIEKVLETNKTKKKTLSKKNNKN
ncbi:hypothetical protein [Aquimarina sp. RZ0]|uniref:hypothetical protein n=1 Tax=Aquimarina sp. RZ0 TaxID=2607730 RepID=UPI0011F19B2D|nr:hypothetical protein [Aquimarina sp. RZ0]KAA1243352.1 hypothetical protein F0000_21340 [Aquimarina sp. RZ0]